MVDKPKMGLGRGLGALIGPSAHQPQQSSASPAENYDSTSALDDVHFLDPKVIRVNNEQPRTRFADEALEELAESIREHGILQPLVVSRHEDGTYELIAGERRLRASRKVGLTRVPVVVRSSEEGKDKLVLALIENIQRQDLNAGEEARAYRRLADEYGFSHEEIARRVGKSRSAVSNAMRILDLDPDMLQALEDGRMTKSHARTLLAEPLPHLRRALFEKMIGSGMTVREAEARAGAPIKRGVRGTKDPRISSLETALRETLGTKVTLDHRGGPGKMIITYYSQEDLKRLVAKISGEGEESEVEV